MKQNEVINNILTRVSNRRFTDEPVSEELIETLLHASDGFWGR
jgi:nitroreductase